MRFHAEKCQPTNSLCVIVLYLCAFLFLLGRSPEGASWFDVAAANFDVRGLRWNPTGCALVMLHTNVLCSALFGTHPKNMLIEEKGCGGGFNEEIENVVVEC